MSETRASEGTPSPATPAPSLRERCEEIIRFGIGGTFPLIEVGCRELLAELDELESTRSALREAQESRAVVGECMDAVYVILERAGFEHARSVQPEVCVQLLADRARTLDRLGDPQHLPEGVADCPTCGARTDQNAFVLYSINRVVQWKAAMRHDDEEGRRICDAAIAEMRGELLDAAAGSTT